MPSTSTESRQLRTLPRPWITVLLVGLLCGCASKREVPPLPVFSSVALASESSGREDLRADSTASKAAGGMAGGGASGAAAGAAVGLACGPLAFFCVPVGLVAGGITGAAAGGFTEGGKGLSAEHSRQVNDVLKNLRAEIDPQEALYQGLRAALPEGFEVAADSAEALVTVEVRLIELRQHADERVSFRINARMDTTWNRDQKKPGAQSNDYVFETAREFVEDWLVDEGAGFKAGFHQCIERVSNWMVRDLNISPTTL